MIAVGIGDWGLGIRDWVLGTGLGTGYWVLGIEIKNLHLFSQSPVTSPQSPVPSPSPQSLILFLLYSKAY